MNKKKKVFDRFTALIIIMFFVFGAIFARLSYIQIVKTDDYKDKANAQNTTTIEEPAPRGEISDKNGVKLATNQQSFELTFTETTDSKLYFYETMDKLYKIIDANKEKQNDDFELKINPFAFEFNAEDQDTRNQLELRFKKDRGLDDAIKNKLFPKLTGDLTDAQQSQIDSKLLDITPEETFNELIKQYNITPEGIFKNYADLYKTDAASAMDIIKKNYKITSEAQVKQLLDIYKNDKKSAKDTLNQLYSVCNVDSKTLSIEQQRRYMLVKDALKMQSYSQHKPVIIASNISKNTAFIIQQQLNDLPGVDVTIQPIRYYPYNQLGSAFLGYISKISTNQTDYEEKGYDVSSDYIGVSGIESALEDYLKGSKGGKVVQLNSQGRITEELGQKESYQGDNVQLTIDSNVQYAAEKALDETMKSLQAKGRQSDVDTSNATRGAAVAVDVNTGAVLALVSRPGFDPNDFASLTGLTNQAYNKYFQPDLEVYGKSRGFSQQLIDKIFPITDSVKGTRKDAYDVVARPLYNYATLSLTPPGSTFKPMTAIAGLESGVITPSTTVDDEMTFDDGHKFHTSFPSDGPNGVVNLVTALAKSSNPFFMTVGQRLRDTYGDDKLAEYAWKFGLGVKPNSGAKAATGIEIKENFGQVFNSVSIKNAFANTYLYTVMDTLKSGRGHNGNSFTPIELHISGDESDDVKSLRQKIRDQVQDSIKTGNTADATYKQLLTQLVNTDPLYKGKTISKNEIGTIASEIEYITVSDAYSQTKVGANMYNASIGQGISNFTPLQLANYVATIVNGGNRYSLHLVDKITDPAGKIVLQNQPQVIEKTGISQTTINAVKAGMQAVTGEDGTAAGVFDGFPIPTAGKTGSATYSKNQDSVGRTSYGVYVGFAPIDKPQIAVAVVIFDGGHGGFIAPVARAMYEAYFKKELDAMNYTPKNDVVAQPLKDN